MEDLSKKIEAILFYSSEPVSVNFLVKILDAKKEEVSQAITELKDRLSGSGIRILEANNEYSLVTAPEFATLIEKMIKEEREKDLGRAGIETLSIIAYKGPVTKKEIEYIRGVNSQYALRNLLLRGLVERKVSQNDERMIVYNITGETIRFLGLSSIEDLPEYKESRAQLEEVKLDESELEANTENGTE
jgi:segregation and condensation protein B